MVCWLCWELDFLRTCKTNTHLHTVVLEYVVMMPPTTSLARVYPVYPTCFLISFNFLFFVNKSIAISNASCTLHGKHLRHFGQCYVQAKKGSMDWDQLWPPTNGRKRQMTDLPEKKNKKNMPCRSLQLPCLWLRWAMLQKDLKRSKVSKVSQGFLQQYYWDHLILKQIHDFLLNMSPWSNPMGRPCTHWADFAVRAKKNRCHHAWAWTEIWTQSGLIEQNYLGTVTIPSFYIYSLSGFSVGS